MTKKSFVIVLVLSIVTSYIADFIDAIVNNTLIGGRTGFPFKDSLSSGFGGTINNYMVALNIIFWFIVIFIAWKLLLRVFKK